MKRLRGTVAVLAVAGLVVMAGCGGADSTTAQPEQTAVEPAVTVNAERPAPTSERPEKRPGGNGGQPKQAEKDQAEVGAKQAYLAYIEAINSRDGGALCRLLRANALLALKPPVRRADCAATLTASIGYRDPRGYPVWKRTDLTGIESSSIGADTDTVRLTAAIVTEFADRSEPSIESDIAYLQSVRGRWQLAKPTGALYRAIGRPEPPPDVIAPPG